MTADLHRVSVALETPRHAALGACLSYRSEQPLAPGTLLRVPLGRRDVPGLVWDAEPADAPALPEGSELREREMSGQGNVGAGRDRIGGTHEFEVGVEGESFGLRTLVTRAHSLAR